MFNIGAAELILVVIVFGIVILFATVIILAIVKNNKGKD